MAEDIHDAPQATWAADPMIPGGRDPGNLTHREPGSIGGQFTGGDIPPGATDWLDATTALEHAREGGGNEATVPRAHHDGRPVP